jgi:hypothetical protein
MASIWLSRPQAASTSTSALIKPGETARPTMLPPAAEHTRLIAFIRHVGCPFAENTVRQYRIWAEQHPDVAVFIVSHGSASATSAWIDAIGGAGRLRPIIDTQRELHAQWGVGLSKLWHFAGPRSLSGVAALWFKGIRNRSASGTRWQRAAVFLVQGDLVVWSHVPASAQAFLLPPERLLASP